MGRIQLPRCKDLTALLRDQSEQVLAATCKGRVAVRPQPQLHLFHDVTPPVYI